METGRASGRRFTLRDALILIAAIAVGLALVRSYLEAERVALRGMESSPSWRVQITAQLLVLSMQSGLLVRSALPPRPPGYRLVRRPGFLAGVAVVTALAMSMIAFVQAGPGPLASTAFNAVWIVDVLLRIRGPLSIAPAVVLAWIIGGLGGIRWNDTDWAEWTGRLFGLFWVIYWCVTVVLRILR